MLIRGICARRFRKCKKYKSKNSTKHKDQQEIEKRRIETPIIDEIQFRTLRKQDNDNCEAELQNLPSDGTHAKNSITTTAIIKYTYKIKITKVLGAIINLFLIFNFLNITVNFKSTIKIFMFVSKS